MKQKDKDNAGVIAPPPLIHLVAILSGVFLSYFWPLKIVPDSIQFSAGAGMIVLAVTLSFLTIREFKKKKTGPSPRKPTTAIITTGPFRYTRNPLYISLSLFHIGIGIAADSVWILVMIVPALILMRYGVISREESYLKRKFGDEYLKYKSSARRWF